MRFSTVFSHEFVQTVKSKSFIVMSVMFGIALVIIAGIVGVMAFAGGSVTAEDIDQSLNSTPAEFYGDELAIVDNTNLNGGLSLAQALSHCEVHLIAQADEAAYEQYISDGIYDAVIVLGEDNGLFTVDIYEQASLYSGSYSEQITPVLDSVYLIKSFEELGVSPPDTAQLLNSSGVSYCNVHTVGDFTLANYLISFFVMILMFVCITLYGQLVATNVAAEKSSRTMELLITCTSPSSLLVGKVLGTGAAALLQMSVFLGCAAGLVSLGCVFSPMLASLVGILLSVSAADIIIIIVFFFLGFLLIAFIFGALGSLVSQLEDLSGLINIPTLFFLVGYMISVFTTTSGMVGPFVRVCSFIPFWSPMVMVVRMAMEPVPMAELVISLVLQALACLVAAAAAVRLYRLGTLMYGKTPKFSEVGKLLRMK